MSVWLYGSESPSHPSDHSPLWSILRLQRQTNSVTSIYLYILLSSRIRTLIEISMAPSPSAMVVVMTRILWESIQVISCKMRFASGFHEFEGYANKEIQLVYYGCNGVTFVVRNYSWNETISLTHHANIWQTTPRDKISLKSIHQCCVFSTHWSRSDDRKWHINVW